MSALPNHDKHAVPDAVRLVRSAGWSLREATFRLDEGGYVCPALNDLSADTSALLAGWAGRTVPPLKKQMPGWFVKAAIDWRQRNGRAY